MTKVLITGANGFIGSKLCKSVSGEKYEVVPATRAQVGSIGQDTDWYQLLQGVDQVIHLAARAHAKHRPKGERLDWFREVNTAGTLSLAKQAIEAGVKRFIFFSTIGVSGDGSSSDGSDVIDEKSKIEPANDYALSKYEAECGLISVFESSECELLIIRPPLVYGADAPGNFRKLLQLADSPLPLPFAKVDNSRSMLSIENLSDFVIRILQTQESHAGTYVLADDETVSMAEIIEALREGLGRSNNNSAVAPGLIKTGAQLTGKAAMYQQLCGNLVISNKKAKATFDWQPPLSASEALYLAARAYLKRVKN
ncbi:hypothetical protein CWE09_05960 [Aliidiomarina minuta]|uniref:NAD-dependent epimerase/dehydratase domain-containing protein n=1 Tax=Aliidiomarina minuta TaxID=880057 RepID=A0A432W819_9GAMM|nr:NAD-dependent epimerase/dehydratase family protein [Aliidiomarina minuta]RUO26257.1 hypothetical protein CWE09_05960 [Aliidiomarina minuta]